MIVILGLHRSGSSCLAGVLHRLGVYMGENFSGCEPDGGYEDGYFARLCERSMRFPSVQQNVSISQFAENAKGWLLRHKGERKVVGIKYPHLCLFVRSLELLEPLVVIHSSRSLEDSMLSLIRRCGKRYSTTALENHQRLLWLMKNDYLEKHEHYTVDYNELVESPHKVISNLGVYLITKGIDINCEILSAVDYVDPSRRHIGKTPQEGYGKRQENMV